MDIKPISSEGPDNTVTVNYPICPIWVQLGNGDPIGLRSAFVSAGYGFRMDVC
jgi:hypothetical protein